MEVFEEISKAAYELWEKGGRVTGKELDTWLEAERTVMERQKQEKCKKEESLEPFEDGDKKPGKSSRKRNRRSGKNNN